jgi:hypothetical protein
MDPDSKPNGPKDKKRGGNLPAQRGRWEIAGSNGYRWNTCSLLGEVGDFGEERGYDSRNVLTWDEAKRSCLEHGGGEVVHEGTGL